MSRARPHSDLERLICRATGATQARRGERVQSLWSGYGEIVRFELEGANAASVIVKHVAPPNSVKHPRGFSDERAHSRKLKSYRVEMAWYESFARQCTARCRVPLAHACHALDGHWVFILEDLDSAGFGGRRQALSAREVEACLSWLAHFHATFVGNTAKNLWKVGCYWHLATRPDELKRMQHQELRAKAQQLDAKLNRCRFKTFVHGDAKVANFCFAEGGSPEVAAVDFQYVGAGPGIKDVAYFFSSIWESDECYAYADEALDSYFTYLSAALGEQAHTGDIEALCAEWRELYAVSWADFYRFLDGWAPGHYKMHPYSQAMTQKALALVD